MNNNIPVEKCILLIGMPGCGKSVIGSLVSRMTKRPFYDTDSMIASQTGISAAKFIPTFGEEEFRLAETEALRSCLSHGGSIISAGGGIVISEENRRLMREKCFVIYIKRSVKRLSLRGRPLSADHRAVKRLYEARRALYEECADIKIENTASARAVAMEIAGLIDPNFIS